MDYEKMWKALKKEIDSLKEYGLSMMSGELDGEETCERVLEMMTQIEGKFSKSSSLFRSISN